MALQSRQMAVACAGVPANMLPGLSSLFWRALGALPLGTLLAVGILVSLATLLLIMGVLGRLRVTGQHLNRRNLLIHVVAALLAYRSQELQHQVYLIIGITWGAYACLKKLATLDAFSGLLCETMVLALPLPASA